MNTDNTPVQHRRSAHSSAPGGLVRSSMRWSSACAALLVACGGGGSSSSSEGATAPRAAGAPDGAASSPVSPIPPVRTDPGPGPYALTVVGGVGPASVPAKSQAEVWATLRPGSEIVTRWNIGNSGSGAGIVGDADEWHATVAVGTAPVTVTAERQTLDITFDLLRYRAPTAVVKTARLHIPPAPRGVILMLHGSGGNSLAIERPETRYLALKAISAGYAVIAPEAEESVAGDLDGDGKLRWDVPLRPSNVDLQALDALLASLVAAGRLPAGLPQFVLGMSNGGAMAMALGAVAHTDRGRALFPRLAFKAVVSYCAQAAPDAVTVTRTPSAWFLCGNDDNDTVDNAIALANSAALAARGVPTQALLHPATPLHDERFTRVPGIDVVRARTVAAELRAAGLVNADDFFSVPSAEIAARVVADPKTFASLAALPGVQQQGVLSQIGVMRAEHEMFSDWSSKTLRWFDANR